jgi:hypothetical protein
VYVAVEVGGTKGVPVGVGEGVADKGKSVWSSVGVEVLMIDVSVAAGAVVTVSVAVDAGLEAF